MVDEHLVVYFKRCREKGYSDEQIKAFLLKKNYPANIIDAAAIASKGVAPMFAVQSQAQSQKTTLSPPSIAAPKDSSDSSMAKPASKAWMIILIFAVIALSVMAYVILNTDSSTLGLRKIADNTSGKDSVDVGANNDTSDMIVNDAPETNMTLPPANLSANVNLSNVTNQTNKTTLIYSSSGGGSRGGGGGGGSNDDDDEPSDPIDDGEPEVQANCTDGVQNQEETGVDCGGPCAECVDNYYLVQGGVPVSDIVVSVTASNMTKLAAEYFRQYIYNMTGVMLQMSDTPNSSLEFHTYIGQSVHTDNLGVTSQGCENGGYKIVSGEDYLVLIGDDEMFELVGPQTAGDWYTATGENWRFDYGGALGQAYSSEKEIRSGDGRGSMNAVHRFLYDQGMRWYYPSAIGTIIPSKGNISFHMMNNTVNPAFAMRAPYIYYKEFGHLRPSLYDEYEDHLRWQLAMGFNDETEFVTGSFVHGITSITSVEATKSEHPEYYSIRDGTRMNGSNPEPDLCSPGLFAENVLYAKALIDLYNATMISVMPSDGFTGASESSPECLARETPERGYEGLLSDYVFEYVNNVSWEIYEDYGVDRKILCAAYTTYLLPPQQLSRPLAPNLQIVLTKWRSDNADEATKDFYENVSNQWLELFTTNNDLTGGVETNKFYTYDYYLINFWESTTESVAAYFPHIIEEDLRFLENKSMGEFMELYSNWPDYGLEWDSFAATGLNMYITAQLYWDTSIDVDDILDEYYVLYYGDAAEKMSEFVNYSEHNYQYAIEDPGVLKNMRSIAHEALDIAGTGTVEGQRIIELLKLINSSYIGEQATISSCATLDSPSTTYVLDSDVSSSSSCFYIDADEVTLDCQGHSITYSTGGGSNDHAIYILEGHPENSFRGDYFNITNCVILDGSYLSGSTTGSAIYLSSSDNGVMKNNHINVSGRGIEAYSSINNLYQNNTVYAYSSDAFFVQYGSYQGSDIVSTNRFIGNLFYSDEGYGAYLYRPWNDTLSGNNFSSVLDNGLNLFVPVDSLLENNYIFSATENALYVYDAINLTTSNNTLVDP